MQVTSATKTVESLAVTAAPTQVFEATLSDEGDFYDMLASNLYTYQKLAVVREVWSNAVDAHKASNLELPVEVTITESEMVFTDFGSGIPHDLIGDIYLSYGKGTKKNDANQIGGFGLGCKAPFSYTSQFTMESCHAGVKSVYSLLKRSNGGKGKPEGNLMVQLPTTQSGVTVRIPLQTGDAGIFLKLLTQVVYTGDYPTNLNGEPMKVVGMPFTPGVLHVIPYSIPIGHIKEFAIRYANVLYPLPEVNTESPEEYRYLYRVLQDFQSMLYRHNLYKNERVLIVIQAEPNSLILQPSREAIAETDSSYVSLIKLMRNCLEAGIKEYIRGYEYGKCLRYAAVKKLAMQGTLVCADQDTPIITKALDLFTLGVTSGKCAAINKQVYPRLLRQAVMNYQATDARTAWLRKVMKEDLKRYCLARIQDKHTVLFTSPFEYGHSETLAGNKQRIYSLGMQINRVYEDLLNSELYQNNKGTFYFLRYKDNYWGNKYLVENDPLKFTITSNPLAYAAISKRICYVSKGIRDIETRLKLVNASVKVAAVYYTKLHFDKVVNQLTPYFDEVIDLTNITVKPKTDKPTVPRVKVHGLPTLRSAIEHGALINKSHLSNTGIVRTTTPSCWITYATAKLLAINTGAIKCLEMHLGDNIGIATSSAHANSYAIKGIPSFDEFIKKEVRTEFDRVKTKMVNAYSRSSQLFHEETDAMQTSINYKKQLDILKQYGFPIVPLTEYHAVYFFKYAPLLNSSYTRKLLNDVNSELTTLILNAKLSPIFKRYIHALTHNYESNITDWTKLNKNGEYYEKASDDIRKKLEAHANLVYNSLRKQK